jgi:uncharacterized protein (TIGR03790 family)
MVLMRGVPLRIANDSSRTGSLEESPSLQTNAAAVDSELALLPIFGLPEGGFVPNIFFDRAATGTVRAGPELATKMILVTRLDGPKPSDVRRMIDDSLYAEENRLAGLTVIDSRGLTDPKNDYTIGDEWLRRSRDMLAKAGWLVRFDDNPDVLPATDPLNHVALYLGWYHDGACGPWLTRSPITCIPLARPRCGMPTRAGSGRSSRGARLPPWAAFTSRTSILRRISIFSPAVCWTATHSSRRLMRRRRRFRGW